MEAAKRLHLWASASNRVFSSSIAVSSPLSLGRGTAPAQVPVRQPSFGASFFVCRGPTLAEGLDPHLPPPPAIGDRQLGLGLAQVEPSSSSTPWLPDREGIFHRRVPDVPVGGSYFCPEGACAFESFGVFCLLAS
ncbi:hypothetical protein ACVWZ4_007308 [Bradyrhizobium sp. USDA 4472]